MNTQVGYSMLAGGANKRHYYHNTSIYLYFSNLLALFWPAALAPTLLNFINYSGAVVMVEGAMYSAVGHRWVALANRWDQDAIIKSLGK